MPKGREQTLQLLLPRKLIPEVLQSCHDDMGHQGRQRTLSLVRERFFWPRMYTEVISYVTSCNRCQHSKATPHVAPMMPIQVSQPFELVHMDFLSLEKCKGQIENVLIVTDHYTRHKHIPVETRQLTPQLESSGSSLLDIMVGHRRSLVTKEETLSQS